MSIAGFHKQEYIDLVAELLDKNRFSDFHKLYRQVDMHEDVRVDNLIYDILSGELYLPYNKREGNKISNLEIAKYFVEWVNLFTTSEVKDCIVKGLNWIKIDIDRSKKK